MFTKTIFSAALTVILFGATIITADAHGPGSHNGPGNTVSSKPIKTVSNAMPRQMQHRRKHGGDANDIEENDDVCKWTKKNGHDVKVCGTDDDE